MGVGVARTLLKGSIETASSEVYVDAISALLHGWDDDNWALWGALFGWVFTHALGGLADAEPEPGAVAEISRDWFDAWLLRRPVDRALEELGVAGDGRERAVAAIRMVLSSPDWLFGQGSEAGVDNDLPSMLRRALAHRDVRAFLGVNRYEGVLWFNREDFRHWLWWMLCIVALRAPELDEEAARTLATVNAWVQELQSVEAIAGYQVERLLAAVKTPDVA